MWVFSNPIFHNMLTVYVHSLNANKTSKSDTDNVKNKASRRSAGEIKKIRWDPIPQESRIDKLFEEPVTFGPINNSAYQRTKNYANVYDNKVNTFSWTLHQIIV